MRKASLIHNKIYLILLIIVVFANCNNNIKSSQEIQESLQSRDSAIDSIIDVIYSIPDPDEILDEIFIEKIEFKSGITNPVENINLYFESKSIALNVGVYLTDMAYLLLGGNNALAIEYFKIIIQLNSDLGLSNFQSADLLFYLNNNINSKDSLYSIFKESIYDIKVELEYSNRNTTLALIYAGSIVESLYLAINNIKYEDSKLIIEKILEQSIIVNNLYDFISQYDKDPEIKSLIGQIDSIKYLMDKCITHDTEVSVQKNEQNQLIFKRGSEINYNIKDFESLRSKILELRNTIITN